MDKSEVRRIVAFLKDVQEGLCEGDEAVTMQAQLTELYRIIKRLMDATSATKDQGKKVLFAALDSNPPSRGTSSPSAPVCAAPGPLLVARTR